jgi:dihydrofolate synthase/folylpolyglutamate synthase
VGLLAASQGKDLRGILAPLSPRLDRAVLTRSTVRRAAAPEELEAAAFDVGLRVEIEPDVGRALDLARQLAPPGGFVVVTGSLYLVGDVLAALEGGGLPGPVAL